MTNKIDRRTAMKTAAGGMAGASLLLTASAATAKQPHMEKALGYLHHAIDELKAANHDKGGHRVRAIELAEKALHQVRQGIKAADS